MKTRYILLAFVPIIFLAASPLRHQAFGPLRFGMTNADAVKAISGIVSQTFQQKQRNLDASDARNHFITSGTKQPARLASKDAAHHINISFNADPLVSVVWVEALDASVDGAKEGWAVFQDIGDAKFTRVGKKGEFPQPDAFAGETDQVITDTWSAEGLHIDLIVKADKSADGAAFKYAVRLKAAEAK